MRRATTIAILTLAVLLAPGLSGAAEARDGDVSRVAIVLAPYLTWEDVRSGYAPTLRRLAQDGAVANINLRNRNPLVSHDTRTIAALTLGSGVWAASDPAAPSAYSVGEHYEVGTAAEAFFRMTGVSSENQAVVYLGMPRTMRFIEEGRGDEVPFGAIGEAITSAGGATAAVGNSDSGYEVRGFWRSRPAALIAMDAEGRVRFGDVSADLLRSDPVAPFGVSTSKDEFEAALNTAMRRLDRTAGPSLIVLDPGDLERAAAFAPDVSPEVAESQHVAAVRTLDWVVDAALEELPEDALILVVPHAAPRPETGEVAGLGPVVAFGREWRGLLSSSSTQRAGLVTNLDVSATVLDALGLQRPVEMLGNPMIDDGSGSSAETRIESLVRTDRAAVAVDSAKRIVLNFYIAMTTVALLLATLVILRARRWPERAVRVATTIGEWVLLLSLALPPASLLMFAFVAWPQSPGVALLALVGTTVPVWAIALAVRRHTSLRLPIAFVSLVATLAILADQWLGGGWSFSSFLGYSPLLAARYYGLGNEGAAVLLGSAMTGIAFVLDEYRERGWSSVARRWFLPAVGFVIVATAASPWLGANVGVAAWGIVGFAVAWAMMNGIRPGLRVFAVAVVLVVVLVAAFSVGDLLQGEGSQTHLGRAWQSARRGGVGELWLIVLRKAETNVRVLTHTNWSYLLVAVLGFLGFMRWRPQGDFAATLSENPHFSAAMAACLVAGAVAYVTEDSGIVIPALIFLYIGTGTVYLMLDRLRHPTPALEADGGVASL